MATVKTGIGLENKMSGELNKIVSQLRNVERELDNAVKGTGKLDKSTLNGLKRQLQVIDTDVENLKNDVDETGDGFKKWQRDIISANSALGLFSKGLGMLKSIGTGVMGMFNEYAESATIETQLNVVMKSSGSSQAEIDDMKNYAKEVSGRSTFDDDAIMAGQAELATYLENKSAIKDMTDLMADYATGMGGPIADTKQMTEYATQLGKALDGQYDGLQKKGFVLTDQQKELMKTGTEAERVAVVTEVINQSWNGLSEAIRNTPQGQLEVMKNNMNDLKQTVGEQLSPLLMELFSKINEVMSDPAVQQFIGGVTIAIGWLISALTWLVGLGQSVIGFVMDNKIVLGLLIATLGTLAIMLVVLGVKALWAGIMMFKAWVLGLNPIYLVIFAIIAVMAILKLLGVSFQTIFGIIGGIVGVTIAIIMNAFIGMYNLVATIINGIAYGFEVAFWGVKTAIVTVVNFVLDQVLKVAKILDKVFGSDLAGKVKDMQGNLNKWAGDMPEWKEVIATKEYVDLSDAWNKGKQIGENIGAGLDNLINSAGNLLNGLDGFDAGAVTDGIVPVEVTGGELDSSGKVDLSDEDLKMLKDVASREFMVKYSQVVPTMTVSFGDVKETADVNAIKAVIEKMTEEELANMYLEEVTVQ